MPDFLMVNDTIDAYKKTWKLFGITVWSVTKTLDKSSFREQIKNEVLNEVNADLDKMFTSPQPPKKA
jgi:hypothetical protein